MICNLSVILKIGNVWGRNVSWAKCPEANCWERNGMEAKQLRDEVSPRQNFGSESSGSHQ